MEVMKAGWHRKVDHRVNLLGRNNGRHLRGMHRQITGQMANSIEQKQDTWAVLRSKCFLLFQISIILPILGGLREEIILETL